MADAWASTHERRPASPSWPPSSRPTWCATAAAASCWCSRSPRRRRRWRCSPSTVGPAWPTCRPALRDGYSTGGTAGTGWARSAAWQPCSTSTPRAGAGTVVLARVAARGRHHAAGAGPRARHHFGGGAPASSNAATPGHRLQDGGTRRAASSTAWVTARWPPPRPRRRVTPSRERPFGEPDEAMRELIGNSTARAAPPVPAHPRPGKGAAALSPAWVISPAVIAVAGARGGSLSHNGTLGARHAARSTSSTTLGLRYACSSCTPTASGAAGHSPPTPDLARTIRR